MKVAYVAGPYRDGRGEWYVEQNIRRARDVALELWRMGYAALCPHANTAHFGGACDDKVWMEGDLELLRRCDLVVMLPDWTASEGAQTEFCEAAARDMPVYLWPDQKEELRDGALS